MTDAPTEEGRPVNFRLDVPAEEAGGSYANFLAVWHTPHEFTFDFANTLPAEVENEADPGSPVVVPCHVVARLKIPVSVVFDVLRAINENMTRYEQRFGEISGGDEQREEGE